MHKITVEKGIFRVLSYQAESVGIINTVALQQDILYICKFKNDKMCPWLSIGYYSIIVDIIS